LDVVLIDRAASFSERDGAPAPPAAASRVGEAMVERDVRAAAGRDSRLLPAAMRAVSDACTKQDKSFAVSAMGDTLTNALLTVTGEIDWRQRARPVRAGQRCQRRTVLPSVLRSRSWSRHVRHPPAFLPP
jgi:hypothetical protein